MNMMKQLYDDGDEEMKVRSTQFVSALIVNPERQKTIGKAMSEARSKRPQ